MESAMEKTIQDFAETRGDLIDKITKIREDLKAKLESLFDQVQVSLQPQIEETEAAIEEHIREFKKLASRKRELQRNMEKLAPVFDIFQRE